MQRRRSFLLLAFAVIALPAIPVSAQQPGARYMINLRYKVDSAKVAEHRDFIKNATAKVMTEWLKLNPKLLGWAAFELNYGGAPLADYNFATTLTFDGPPPEDGMVTFQAAVKNAGMAYEAYQAKMRSLRTLVGQQLRRSVASTGTTGGEWLVVNYYKIDPRRRSEAIDQLRTISQPIFSMMAKENAIAGWGATEVVFPQGQSFDLAAFTSYNSLADAVRYGYAGGGRSFSTYFAKAHPDKSYILFVDSLRANRTMVRSDLLHRVARVAR
ncbi:MAG: hypothetical protein JNN08_01175 [Bryobacterales bacterium]|nr:hypothetical protein [Bryobacterales bacterium]